MQEIEANGYTVVFENQGYTHLNKLISEANYSSVFVLVDSNTHEYCLAHVLANLETHLRIEIIEIDAGEQYKNIETCNGVWSVLSELDADRKSLLINIGGGVVTDLGGFVACTFKRGIDYINIPTTLLAMVDASVGGKTGVDLGSLKNQIGVISNPLMVLVDPWFLGSLPMIQLRSGYAEMLKHGLIVDRTYWNNLCSDRYDNLDGLGSLIRKSIVIKNDIVTVDPREQHQRKALNFGHTLGHAIESYFMDKEESKQLLHGEAIAIGMILAAYISSVQVGLPPKERDHIILNILQYYDKVNFELQDIDPIISLLKYDKKNSHGEVLFVLLKEIGVPTFNEKVDNETIKDAFSFYKDFKISA